MTASAAVIAIESRHVQAAGLSPRVLALHGRAPRRVVTILIESDRRFRFSAAAQESRTRSALPFEVRSEVRILVDGLLTQLLAPDIDSSVHFGHPHLHVAQEVRAALASSSRLRGILRFLRLYEKALLGAILVLRIDEELDLVVIVFVAVFLRLILVGAFGAEVFRSGRLRGTRHAPFSPGSLRCVGNFKRLRRIGRIQHFGGFSLLRVYRTVGG